MPADRSAPLPGAPDPWAPSEMPRLRSRPPFLMSEMIAAEPAVAERLVRRLARDGAMAALTDAVAAGVAARAPLLLTGCGTSEHAAMAGAAILAEALDADRGREPQAVQALEAAARPPREGLLLAISHEGGTWATNEALRAARAAGARTALITVSGRSPGAELAELVVETEEQDQSWCHTVGYLAPITAISVLGARLAERRLDAVALRALLDVTDDPHGAAACASGLAGCDRIIVAGTGIDHVAARELALKIEEGARLPARALELETVLHGHLAAADERTGLVLVLTDAERVGPARLERARAVLGAAAALGMPAVAIVGADLGDDLPRDLTPAGRIAVSLAGRLPTVAAAAMATAISLQLLTERLARARKVNPDTLGRDDPRQAAAHA